MTHDQTPENVAQTIPAPRRAWVTPELSSIPANTAEIGANPISPEGAFGTGS